MEFLKKYRSPNYNLRPSKISHIVLHYTEFKTAQESIDHLCHVKTKVSAHYVIDYNGDIYEWVDPNNRAWHAGVSCWQGIPNVNDYSIGIELQNTGIKDNFTEKYPIIQMEALVSLLTDLSSQYDIDPRNVIGHCHVAPDRKIDPGPHFDWTWLKHQGFGQ
jgi:N-acetylmuramoyl-L-alanine amidase